MTFYSDRFIASHEKLLRFLQEKDVKSLLLKTNGVDAAENQWLVYYKESMLVAYRSRDFKIFDQKEIEDEIYEETQEDVRLYMVKACNSLGYVTRNNSSMSPDEQKIMVELIKSELEHLKKTEKIPQETESSNNACLRTSLSNGSLIRVLHRNEKDVIINERLALNPTGLLEVIMSSEYTTDPYSETVTIQRIKIKQSPIQKTFFELIANYFENDISFTENTMYPKKKLNNFFVDVLEEIHVNIRPMVLFAGYIFENRIKKNNSISVEATLQNTYSKKTEELFSSVKQIYKTQPILSDHKRTHLLGSFLLWKVYSLSYNSLKFVYDADVNTNIVYWTGETIDVIDFYYDKDSSVFEYIMASLHSALMSRPQMDYYNKSVGKEKTGYPVFLKSVKQKYDKSELKETVFDLRKSIFYFQGTATIRLKDMDESMKKEGFFVTPLVIKNFLK